MMEETHYGDRVPVWDGDTRQWKRYLQDVELYLETEKLDVDIPHGARLLSFLTGSARKYAEIIELDKVRRITGADRDTREGMIPGVKYLLKFLETATGMEEATKKGQVEEFLHKKLHRRPGQPMAEWVNVCESGARHEGRRAECRAQDHGLASFRKEQI